MTAAERLKRLGLRPGRMRPARLWYGLRRPVYATPLYHFILSGRTPRRLAVSPPDPWPGDPERGRAILAGEYDLAGEHDLAGESRRGRGGIWSPTGSPGAGLDALHGFAWLGDLRAVGTDDARRRARELVAGWIGRFGRWNAVAWRPDVLGRRVTAWLTHHDFFCASADDAFRARFFGSLARQARHLARATPSGDEGVRLLLAIKGIIYSGACLPGEAARLARGLRLLDRELNRQIRPDGGHHQRSPSVQLAVLRHLIDVRATLVAARQEAPGGLQTAIDRMAPMLRFFRHGDGGLALFNNTCEEEAGLIDRVLFQADARGRPPSSAPHTGFERLTAGRTVVIAEVGAPSAPGIDDDNHAGTLSFEMSVGKERLVVNCGAYTGRDPKWRAVPRTTAAHSTVVVGDTNSSEILPNGTIGRRPDRVTCRRGESDGNIWIDASHDGYLEDFGVIHRRRLYLGADGDDFRGEDTLTGPGGQDFAVRFHLHPAVQVSPVQTGEAALLRLPGGAGWRFRASGGRLGVSEDVYLGVRGKIKRSEQIVVTGRLEGGEAVIKWAFRRIGRP
jgi:uncharacterized heparinase superfamily protein